MFRMVNKYGNVEMNVKAEKKKDELLECGWKVVEEPQQGEDKPKGGKKSKAVEKE